MRDALQQRGGVAQHGLAALLRQLVLEAAHVGDADGFAVAANHVALQKLAESQRTAEALSARMKAAFAAGGAQAGKDGQCASDPSVVAAAKGGAL